MTGQQLVDRLTAWIGSFCKISETQLLVCAVWAVHTYFTSKLHTTPYLQIGATGPGSGKTILLEVIASLSRKSELQAIIRPAAIVRAIFDAGGDCTIFLDEAEKLSNAGLNETRSMLATGYRQGQSWPVSVGQKRIKMPTYCPKAFALIGDLQPVLRQRAIMIDIERGHPARQWSIEHERGMMEAAELRGEIERLLTDGRNLTRVDPDWLTESRDREIWAAMFTVAATLGLHKQTVDHLVAASVDLSALQQRPQRPHHSTSSDEDTTERVYAERLVRDVRSVWGDDEKQIPSAEIVRRLHAIATGPWRSYRLRGLDEIGLSQLLARFDVRPDTLYLGGGRKQKIQAKGYKRTALDSIKL